MAEFLDLSGNNPDLQWSLVPPEIVGVGVKLTEGVNFEDPKAKSHCRGTRDSGRLLVGYHYLRIRHGKPQDSAEQAAEFAQVYLREQCKAAAIDTERAENEGATSQEVHDAARSFATELFAILNPPTMIYTSRGEWLNWILESATEFGAIPLWLAAYTLTPIVPPPWKDYLLWQYTGSGSCMGVTGRVDRSRTRGTFDEFKAALAISG